ncbi:hypothetical protein [Sinomonas halotolerans]|uniref:Transmembrane protein n=1 Tax=Sinomonas halotolerans TaxID=1644133 RepID=A0ABU9X0Q7_9MICC
MDVLSTMGTDDLRTAVWIVAVAATVAVAALQLLAPTARRSGKDWRPAGLAALQSLRAGAGAYAAASLAAAFYILGHASDVRWSAGRDAPFDVPELAPSLPLFDGIVNALNGFASTVESGVNDALAIKNAFIVSGDFMVMALWGTVAMVCIAIAAFLLGRHVEAQRVRQLDELAVRQRHLEAEVGRLRDRLELLSLNSPAANQPPTS